MYVYAYNADIWYQNGEFMNIQRDVKKGFIDSVHLKPNWLRKICAVYFFFM